MRTEQRVAVVALVLAVLASGCGPPPTALDRAAASGQDAVTRCEEAYARAYLAFKAGRITEADRDAARNLCRGARSSADQLGLLLRTARATGDTALADPVTATAVARHISTINQAAATIAAIAAKGGQ